MKTLNKVILQGVVGSEPVTRVTIQSEELVIFTLGTEENILGKTQFIWHNIVVVKPNLGLFVKKHINKGRQVLVEGMLYSRKEMTKLGARYTQEVLLCSDEHTIDFLRSAHRLTETWSRRGAILPPVSILTG